MSDHAELQPVLAALMRGQVLDQAAAYEAFGHIMAGRATDAQIGALLMALAARPDGPTIDEITGAARAMRDHVRRVSAPSAMQDQIIDTCGTGGDRSGTFNISTTAALIAAAAGARVAKHGNRAATSMSGSSQVLEALGVKLEVDDATLVRCLMRARICFCFAPAHHPAMKHAAGPRKQLGFRTIFNLLGPLTNPAGATRQLIGVSDPNLTETIAQVLESLGTRVAMVVHGQGLDELTTTGATRISTLRQGLISTTTVTPEDLGLTRAHLEALRVRDVAESASMVQAVLAGEKGPARDIACLNAAAALVVADIAEDLASGLQLAAKAIDSAAAQATLVKLVQITNDAVGVH